MEIAGVRAWAAIPQATRFIEGDGPSAVSRSRT